jgi:hypothetical protein
MADLVQTSTSVVPVSGGYTADFNGGATITAGSPVYLDASNLWQKAQADTAAHLGVVAGVPTRVGILLSDTISGRRALVFEGTGGGVINVGATLTVGVTYVISAANPGKIAPITDLTSTNNLFYLGVGKTAANLDMTLKSAYTNGYTGIVLP